MALIWYKNLFIVSDCGIKGFNNNYIMYPSLITVLCLFMFIALTVHDTTMVSLSPV